MASARGHDVTVYEAEGETGGHVRVQSLLPTRAEYGEIGRWLAAQAEKNGARIVTGAPVTADDLDQALEDGEARPRGGRHRVRRRRRRLPGLDRRGAARLGERQLRRLGHGGCRARPGRAAG